MMDGIPVKKYVLFADVCLKKKYKLRGRKSFILNVLSIKNCTCAS